MINVLNFDGNRVGNSLEWLYADLSRGESRSGVRHVGVERVGNDGGSGDDVVV
jgi:hypothetical protein